MGFCLRNGGFDTGSNAYAQANSIQEIGSDVLEMDTVFTEDGVPVIWHDAC